LLLPNGTEIAKLREIGCAFLRLGAFQCVIK
jgi:hypothetical protein